MAYPNDAVPKSRGLVQAACILGPVTGTVVLVLAKVQEVTPLTAFWVVVASALAGAIAYRIVSGGPVSRWVRSQAQNLLNLPDGPQPGGNLPAPGAHDQLPGHGALPPGVVSLAPNRGTAGNGHGQA